MNMGIVKMHLPFVDCDKSELQACGSKFKNTSPSKPPTAKLSIIFSDFDSVAENENPFQKIYLIISNIITNIENMRLWLIVAPNFNL